MLEQEKKTNNLEQVHDYLNMNMNQALGYITVNWHEAREEMFSPEFASEQPPTDINFDETHFYYLLKMKVKIWSTVTVKINKSTNYFWFS